MNFPLIANIVVFVVLLFALAQTRHKQWSLAKKVLVGLVMGVVFGLALHTIYGSDSQVLKDSVQWFNIVGNGYVQLLQMIVMPLVFASILSAVARLHNASQLGKISFLTIGTLLFTTLIAALVGVNRPGFPGECFICELRLPDHRFRWKHNKLFLLLPEGCGPAFPAIVDYYTSPPT